MKIEQIIGDEKIVRIVGDFSNIDITNLSCDTKEIINGTLFFCLKGNKVDGHNYAQNAKELGAVALVVEKLLEVDLPQVVVESSRYSMAIFAGNFYKNPRNKLKLIGITGTNGKTTSTYMIQSILKDAGYKVGVIGTIGIMINDICLPATLTTPDPIQLHKIFSQMVENDVNIVVMEVSAHAIALNKMAGIKCDVGILTNVTQDHLDFFKTFSNYAKIKESFISNKFCEIGVVNLDDKIGKQIVLKNMANKNNFEILSYGLHSPSHIFAVDTKYSMEGTTYHINLFDEIYKVNTKLIGEFNLLNALGAATACKALGIKNQIIIKGLEDMDFVPGRFNVINLGDNKSVIIDYAHTPDGLQNILSATRMVTKGKIISVFGCGGNRDTSKRPIMGKISAELADFSILTSDNPRLEKPELIIQDIEQGVKSQTENYLCITDRKQAISYAISILKEGDVAVISGKGAENYLDICGVKYPYSDFETVMEEKQKLVHKLEGVLE